MLSLSALKTCSFLEKQLARLKSAISEYDAEKIMQEVSRYDFPRICGEMRYDSPLIRCVKIDRNYECVDITSKISRFSYPPPEYVKSPGRVNISGFPVFYAANDVSTALLESNIHEGDEFYAGIWMIDAGTKMNAYPCIPYQQISKLSDLGDDKAKNLKSFIDLHNELKQLLDRYAYIFSIPHTTDAPDAQNLYIYYLSGAIGHSIINRPMYIKEGSMMTDAILYPSVKSDGKSYNLAINKYFVDKHMKLKYVVRGRLKNGKVSFSIDDVGFNENCSVIWKQMHKQIKGVHILNISDKNGIHKPLDNETIKYEGNIYTISMFEKFIFERLNCSNTPLKEIRFDKDENIDIVNPSWTDSWEGETTELLILDIGNTTEVQCAATIESFFSTDGVKSALSTTK